MGLKPAWSEAFDEGRLQPVSVLGLPQRVTREWAWEGGTGKGVKVAIVDSGVDAAHPLVGSVTRSVVVEYDKNAEGLARVREEDGHQDVFGHGTACAGIIRKAAPEAEIYSIRVLGTFLTGKAPVFIAGLKWAIDNGINVVNLSLSTSKHEFFGKFHELTDEAYFRNVMLVSAINNNPEPSYPSQYSSVFSVAAHERYDPYGFDYNPEPPVEFGAPGIDVDVAWANGSVIKSTGNSFAAPHITGLIAKILSKHPGLTPFQMKTILASIADNAGD